MMRLRPFCAAAGAILAIIGLARPAAAQTNDEIFQNLQWNFSTPGARANGMGKTFIGKADDASAAVTNPAGLMSMTRPQVYAEFKATRLRAERLSAADSLTTLQATTTTTDINALSFASFSAPLGSKLAVAFSVHRFLDYEETFNLAARSIPGTTGSFFPVTGNMDFAGTAFGGSVAYMVTNGLRVGVTVASNRLEADAVTTRTGIGTLASLTTNQTTISDSQTAMSVTVGGLYRLQNDKATIGFRYTKSPRFNTETTLRVNNGYPSTNQPLTPLADFPKPVAVNVPDQFGFGVAVRPNSRLLVAADVVRTKYSSLTRDTTVVFYLSAVQGTEFETPDTTEVHVGAEYMLGTIMSRALLIRGGVFTNPSHSTSYTGAHPQSKAFYSLPGKDDTRGTVGAGVVLGSRAQVDVAYIFGREFVASTAVRF